VQVCRPVPIGDATVPPQTAAAVPDGAAPGGRLLSLSERPRSSRGRARGRVCYASSADAGDLRTVAV